MLSGNEYLEVITKRLAPYFDLAPKEPVAGQTMNLWPVLTCVTRSISLKKITLYAYENHETVLVRCQDRITPQVAEEFCAYLKRAVTELVNPSQEHMSSIVTGVWWLLLASLLRPDVLSNVSRYSRNFSFLTRLVRGEASGGRSCR